MSYSKALKFIPLSILCSFLLISCGGTMPTLGGGTGNTVTGAAAGSSSEGNNSGLESCSEPLGTLAVYEDQTLQWWGYYRRYYPNLGSTVPVIRTMIQQSNCFVVVERGKAMQAMERERNLMNSGQMRSNSNFGQGQMVSADYTLSPSVQFKESNLGRIAGAASRFLPGPLGSFGAASVGTKSNEASATILMIDNRSGVQVSSSVGSAKNFDFSFRGFSWGGGGFGSISGFTDTAEGKVIVAAFADSYNKMVKALRNYKPQTVKGGLGTGGALKVDGAVDVPQSQPQSSYTPQVKSAAPAVAVVNNSNSASYGSGTVKKENIFYQQKKRTSRAYGQLTVSTEENAKGHTRIVLRNCSHPRIGNQISCRLGLREINAKNFLMQEAFYFHRSGETKSVAAGRFYAIADFSGGSAAKHHASGEVNIQVGLTNFIDIVLE